MNKDELCLTCPKPKWVSFAFETEGNEPAPAKINQAEPERDTVMSMVQFKYAFSPALTGGDRGQYVRLTEKTAWLPLPQPGGYTTGEPCEYKTLAETVSVKLMMSPEYMNILSGGWIDEPDT